MMYLLDTNICITIIRTRPAALIQKLVSHQPGEVGVSSITLAELFHGAAKSAQPDQNMAALQQFLLPLILAEFDQQAAHAYGKIRAELERKGQVIGSMDMLIAAHATSLGAILITNNLREFRRVKGLALEDWL